MENEEYDTIDLLEVLNAVRQHIAVLILCTLATGDCRLCNHAFLDYPAVRVLCFDDRQYPSGHDFHRHQRPDQLSYQAGFHLQHHY